MKKGITAVVLFVLCYAITLPIVFFYVAMATVFQSSYYADLMAMREFALQFFLLDLIQGMKWSAVTAFTMVPVFGAGLYGLFVLAKRVFVKASNSEPTKRTETASDQTHVESKPLLKSVTVTENFKEYP